MEESVARSFWKSTGREKSIVESQESPGSRQNKAAKPNRYSFLIRRNRCGRKTAVSRQGPTFFQCEELRVVWGTRGNPGTVAPFRAWRGSRDLVAQSPKLHAPAVANCRTAK